MAHYNPYEDMLHTLVSAADALGLSNNDIERFKYPERELKVSIPIHRDNGDIAVYSGYRVQHSTILGPAKGGLRFHADEDQDEVKALAAWMTIKNSLAGLPYGGGKGGIKVDPKTLSIRELERLTRGFIRQIEPFIGLDKDIPAPDVNTNPTIMGWIVDEYSTIMGEWTPGVVTGKPVAIGGSLGRTEATGRGCYFVLGHYLRAQNKKMSDVTVAVQGFGNVGSVGALLMHRDGAKVVAIGDYNGSLYNPDGLDVEAAYAYANSHGRSLKGYEEPNMQRIDKDDILTLDVDVLYMAALENQLNESNMREVKAKIILEGANGPTAKEADAYFHEHGIHVIPDVLANAGGVIVSYYEWVQNKQGYYWPEELVNQRLGENMRKSFNAVRDCVLQYNVRPRLACYMVALRRLVEVSNLRGFNG